MKAADFNYHRPDTLDVALGLLAGEETVPLAGGQSLMPMMNFRIAQPGALVDLNAIDELAGIDVADGWVRIGAMTRYRDVANAPQIAKQVPLLARALPHIAHPAIRNRGTLGGSCALADPAAEVPAVLLAAGGRLALRRRSGERLVAAEEFFLGLYETALADGELVAGVHIPVALPSDRFGFHEITRRHGDYATAGCAIAASGDLSTVRIALFGVSDRALRATAAELVLSEQGGSAEALDGAVEALEEIEFHEDLHAGAVTKRHLAGVALRRAWSEAMA